MPYYIMVQDRFQSVSRSTWKRRRKGPKSSDTLPIDDAVSNNKVEEFEGLNITQNESPFCEVVNETLNNPDDTDLSESEEIPPTFEDDSDDISNDVVAPPTPPPSHPQVNLFTTSTDTTPGEEEKSLLQVLLAEWAVRRGVTQGSASELLHILKDPRIDLLSLANLPLSLQTLKKIPKSRVPFSPEIKKLAGGEYAYFGIENNLNCRNANFWDREEEVIELAFNTDGVEIIDSSPSCLWPILGQCHGCRVFLIALYHGQTKPNNFNDFFHDFVEETKYLKEKYGSKFEVLFFTADTPAKAATLSIKGPNGFFSCTKCIIPGERSYKEIESDKGKKPTAKKRKLKLGEDTNDEDKEPAVKRKKSNEKKTIKSNIYFVGKKYRKRRHTDYENVSPNTEKRKNEDPKLIFHHGITKLREIPGFDLVKDVVIDVQHAGYLNSMKKLAEYYVIGYNIFGGKSTRRRSLMGAKNVSSLSTDLENLHTWCPTEFARKPRKITMLSDWKTTELRQFLEYTGVVLLKKYLPEDHYTCFKTLALAMRVLNMEEDTVTKDRINHAKYLIEYFLEQCSELYGPQFITHSIHILRHLPDDCLRFQRTAVALSCLPFENFNFELSSSVKSGNRPLQQIINRYNEYVYWSKYKQNVEASTGNSKIQFRVGNYIFRSDRKGDSFCAIGSDNHYRLFQITSFNSGVIKGREFETVEAIFSLPDDSRFYGYYKCKNLSSIISSFKPEEICAKFYPIPSTDKPNTLILVKLQHGF